MSDRGRAGRGLYQRRRRPCCGAFFESSPHWPPSRPSQNQYSHRGRLRSIGRDITRLSSRSISPRPPGVGRAGAPNMPVQGEVWVVDPGRGCETERHRAASGDNAGSAAAGPSIERTNSPKSGAGPSKMAHEPIAREAVGSTSSASRKLAARGESVHLVSLAAWPRSLQSRRSPALPKYAGTGGDWRPHDLLVSWLTSCRGVRRVPPRAWRRGCGTVSTRRSRARWTRRSGSSPGPLRARRRRRG